MMLDYVRQIFIAMFVLKIASAVECDRTKIQGE